MKLFPSVGLTFYFGQEIYQKGILLLNRLVFLLSNPSKLQQEKKVFSLMLLFVIYCYEREFSSSIH